ncbi:chalcone isomerase family protein [Aquabacterium sp.]|uniref:chalcone isomerase family protein n=1 Tax=Aquabacterium sp. TaxID=1872578 RepID=UPI0035AF68F6
MRSLPRKIALVCMGLSAWVGALAAELEGVPVKETTVLDGATLTLNGAAVLKRGYFKTNVTAIYLSEPRHTMDGIYKLHGPKRIELTLLRDLTGPMLSRYFVADFKSAASEAEFKQLIPQVGRLGGIYSAIGKISKGDVVRMDWHPGVGITGSINGKPLVDASEAMNSELMFQIFLRMYMMTPGCGPDYTQALLGA